MSSDSPYKSTRSRTRVANQNNALFLQDSLEVISSSPISPPKSPPCQSKISIQSPITNQVPQPAEQSSVIQIEPTTGQLSLNERRKLSAPAKRAPQLSSSEITLESVKDLIKKKKNQQSDEILDQQLEQQIDQQQIVINSRQFKERHSTISLENDVSSSGCLFVRTDSNFYKKNLKIEYILIFI
jgi:hypothetical protein